MVNVLHQVSHMISIDIGKVMIYKSQTWIFKINSVSQDKVRCVQNRRHMVVDLARLCLQPLLLYVASP